MDKVGLNAHTTNVVNMGLGEKRYRDVRSSVPALIHAPTCRYGHMLIIFTIWRARTVNVESIRK